MSRSRLILWLLGLVVLALVAVLGLQLLGSPGTGATLPAAGSGLDLLVRSPDAKFEQPGPLRPAPLSDWGPAGGAGWARLEPHLPWKRADGSWYLETNQPTARLKLRAPERATREVELTLWRATPRPGVPPGDVRLELNGIQVPGTLALTDEETTHRITIDQAAWVRGDNVLTLHVERGGAADPRGRDWDTLAVGELRWGDERTIELDPATSRATLPDTCGLRWFAEAGPGGGLLVLAGEARGPGELCVELATMDPRDGTLAGEELTTISLDGLFERAFVLPQTDLASAVTVSWLAADGAELALTRAEVHENEPRERPLVLVISVDTLAADHCSVYGYDRPTTPELEELARDGVVFERCVANAPWTLPSYLSVLTGLYPSAHLAQGIVEDGALDNYDFWKVAQNRWTLAETLRARGYQTAASLDTAWLSPRFQIDQGFDLYDMGPSSYGFYEAYYGIRYITDQFEKYLDQLRRDDAPFFAFIHALDAHGPYWPEEGFLGRFDGLLPPDLRPTLAGAAPQTFGAMPAWMAQTLCPPVHRPQPEVWSIPREVPLEEIIARYDEAILKTDFSIGAICDLLKERGLYDDALIVITGDHGESFAHGSFSHGVLWEDVVRVPLLLKLPRNAHAGKRIDTSVQLVDLYPTLFELVGAGAPRDYLHGRSLVPLLEGDPAPERPTFSEGGHIDQRMVEFEGWKLIETRPGYQAGLAPLITHPRVREAWLEEHLPELAASGILTEELRVQAARDPDLRAPFEELKQELRGPFYELYHLPDDPEEERDLAGAHPDRVQALLERMRAEEARGRNAQKDARSDGVAPRLSPAELEALQDLGYTGEEIEAGG